MTEEFKNQIGKIPDSINMGQKQIWPFFETKIPDKQEKRLQEFDGLAMLLVDVDYDGKIFDMDRTVFAKDIGDDGVIKVTGLTESITVFDIDKHGNESKPFIVWR